MNPQCAQELESGAYFCGIAGATCTTNSNCDGGPCVDGIWSVERSLIAAALRAIADACYFLSLTAKEASSKLAAPTTPTAPDSSTVSTKTSKLPRPTPAEVRHCTLIRREPFLLLTLLSAGIGAFCQDSTQGSIADCEPP